MTAIVPEFPYIDEIMSKRVILAWSGRKRPVRLADDLGASARRPHPSLARDERQRAPGSRRRAHQAMRGVSDRAR
ncbi:hypothetical protein [Sorangium sp. So ce117]|uniref:hypothetical protein n=1 Tax=Sorangium sp. So ce117 TaxID=3133277 RepID=UPI003F638F90